ncbi:MAG: CocE/NonD family hydrolase [Pseudomonadota bacterium]
MNKTLPLLAALLCAALITACNNSAPGKIGAGASTAHGNVTVPVTETRAGTQQHVVIPSPVDGLDVSFEMFEPDQLVAGESYPLILEGHGYSGTRREVREGFVARLTAAGYYVISIDQRGFGQSGGTVRSMSPDFEGQNLIAILDWAESLPGLRRRDDGSMRVGSYGSSYGGMYQMLLAAADPQQRLRVLAPDITPHDLVYALNPNNVVKSGWGLALVGAGEAGAQANNGVGQPRDPDPQGGQDPVLFEIVLGSTLANSFTESANNFFRYHSVKYFCDGVAAGSQSFMVGDPDPLAVPPNPYGKIDVLFTQGFRDTLFNFNDGLNNYNCLKARGGDVRLLTHQSGHILAVGPAGGGGLVPLPVPSIEEPLDPFYAALTLPGFQDPGSARSCGAINLDDAQFAWFEEKLQDRGNANSVITSGSNICLSLAEGDAVTLPTVKTGSTEPEDEFEVEGSIPQFSSALGVGGALLGNAAREALLATLPLYTAPAGGAILAGVPVMNLQLEGVSGIEPGTCPTPLSLAACDPIMFLGIGHRKAGSERWDLVDDQLTPMRSFGAHTDPMSGVAERLNEGDEVALLIYGFHAQFPVTWSRDVFVPAANLSGTLQLPILAPSEVSSF